MNDESRAKELKVGSAQSDYQSWGRYPRALQQIVPLQWRDTITFPTGGVMLPQGMARSYGDVCLNDGGMILATRALDRLISFDNESGVLRAEAGVTLADILRTFVPRGWFVPVSPGTRFVTLGGAIANDIHGKDHHHSGTFGSHVRAFELVRSDGVSRVCSLTENSEFFRATIGGLGLTGLMTWVEIQLRAIPSSWIAMESIKFGSLDEFFGISAESSESFAYTVAWLDCVASGTKFGRGIFMRGNWSEISKPNSIWQPRLSLNVPVDMPSWVLNPFSVRVFNLLYYGKQREKKVASTLSYEPFFYPLDGVLNWNRIYGKGGFVQFQCVVPTKEALRELLQVVVRSGRASFLAVLKEFGASVSPGMLSFPRPGVTLALDFPFQGQKTLELMGALDTLTKQAGGAVYPAKDACMPAESFQQYYPGHAKFRTYIDPHFSSSFWRRVSGLVKEDL